MRIPIYPLYLNIELILSDDGRTLIEASGLASSYIGRVIIPDGIESIRKGAFKGCINLTEIHLPTSVVDIEQETFDECVSLTSIEVSKDNKRYMSEDGILYDRKRSSIMRMPMANTKSSVSFPDWVRRVDSGAFKKCKNIKEIIISSTLTEIDDYAFCKCYSLVSMRMSDDVKGANGIALENEIHIPHGVKRIGASAFFDCRSISKVHLPSTLEEFGERVFEECNNLKQLTIPMGCREIPNSMFSWCRSLKEVNIPNSVVRIGSWAFVGCRHLIGVDIPSVVTEIGYGAFRDCLHLRYFRLPGGLTEIKGETFNSCIKKKRIIIPEGVRKVGDSAIRLCESLEFLSLPSTLEEISFGGFGQCHKLRQIRCYSKKPDGISMSKSAFLDMDLSLCTLQVPMGMEQIYRNHFVFGLFGVIEAVL